MFDVKKECENIERFIHDYFDKCNLGGVVIGISGGKDSGVVAGLFTRALGKDRVVGVTMPCHSKDKDRDLALVLAEYYGFRLVDVNLDKTFDTMTNDIVKNMGEISTNTLDADINLKPRLRMSTLYYMAATLSSIEGRTYIVAGTSNKCELYVGYFTKGGDNVNDIAVLSDYTVDEVIAIGEYIGVPSEILYRTPSDGLSKMSDEDKLGVKYLDIAKVIEGDTSSLDKATIERISMLHRSTRHKFLDNYFKRGGV